jgi:TPR repeat protein
MAVGRVAVAGENKPLKGELQTELAGKTVISRIVFGGRAVPQGYQFDYPVNTLVFPDTESVTYRVEWGVMRAEIGESQMLRRFESGTSFRVTGVDAKDDRLELKLEGSGGSARLKLMLGAGWQSKLDSASVQAQLGRVFVFEQWPAPVSAAAAGSADRSSAVPSAQRSQPPFVNGAAVFALSSPASPTGNEVMPSTERLSQQDLEALLSSANSTEVMSDHAFRMLNALVAYRQRVGAPCHRDDIPKFAKRYGGASSIDAPAANEILAVYIDCSRYQGDYIPVPGVSDGRSFVQSMEQLIRGSGMFGPASSDPTAVIVSGIRDVETALDTNDYLQSLIDYEAVRAGSAAVEYRRNKHVRPSNVYTLSPEYWSSVASGSPANVADIPVAIEYLGRTTALYKDLKRFADAEIALVNSNVDAAKKIQYEMAYVPMRQELSSRIEEKEAIESAQAAARPRAQDLAAFAEQLRQTATAGAAHPQTLNPSERRAEVAKRVQETLHDGSIWVVAGNENTTLLGYFTDSLAMGRMQHPQSNTSQMRVLSSLHRLSDSEVGIIDPGEWLYSLICLADTQKNVSCRRLTLFGASSVGASDYSPEERKSFESGFLAAQQISQKADADTEADSKTLAELEQRSLASERLPAEDAEVSGWLRNGESCYFGTPGTESGCNGTDYEKAHEWFRIAAQRGDPKAMWYLGSMYSLGNGVAQDNGRALGWYTGSAERGNSDAQFVLGQMYYQALGTPQNYAMAFQWWGKAAARGDAAAQSNLGMMYETGQGVPQNFGKALDLFTKSARAGNVYGEFDLGDMYENGRGVKQDYAAACEWYERAAAQGHKDAASRLELLAETKHILTPAEQRKQFAEDLTGRMSKEISWCAGGSNGELLTGYVTTSQLSPGTSTLLAAESPLYGQLYHEGFRYLGMFDHDQSTKTAALTPTGIAPASITAISDLERAYMDHAISVLMHVANGVDESSYRRVEGGKVVTECIPAKAPDACPDGQLRRFMPSVGNYCAPK